MSQSKQFLTLLCGSEDTPQRWQVFDDGDATRKSGFHAENWYASFKDAKAKLTERNNAGQGVFLAPNATDGKGLTEGCVTAIRAFWIDKDKGDPIKSFKLPPTCIVRRTPNKYHAYWMIHADEQALTDVKLFRPVQTALSNLYDSDPAVCNPNRVMRFPNFLWAKELPPMPYNLEVISGSTYSVQDILAAHNLTNVKPEAEREVVLEWTQSATYDPLKKQVIKEFLEGLNVDPSGGAAKNSRHNCALSIATNMLYAGAEPSEISETIIGWMEKHGRSPEDSEIMGIIRFASSKLSRGEATVCERLKTVTDMALDVEEVEALCKAPDQSGEMMEKLKAREAVELDKTQTRNSLACTPKGDVKGTAANLNLILREWPELKDIFFYNVLEQAIGMTRSLPWETKRIIGDTGHAWEDSDTARFKRWLIEEGLGEYSIANLSEMILAFAHDRCIDPIRDKLSSLAWDGTDRLSSWLVDYCGATGNPTYLKEIGTRWMISAVNRVFRPGCQADYMIVLEGKQGMKKSTMLKELCYGYFTDNLEDFKGKDAAISLNGNWIVEISELGAMSRSKVKDVKAFLSRTTDKFRPPFGRNLMSCARRCVFVGTTNDFEYLKDDTGNRRFWPVTVASVDRDAIVRDRDQLWAEAVARFHRGEKPYIESAEMEIVVEHEQKARQIGDDLDQEILNFAADKPEGFNIKELYESVLHCLEVPDKGTQMRVSGALRRIGYSKSRKEIGGVRVTFYSREL